MTGQGTPTPSLRVGLEIQRTEAITLARPHERAAADVIAAQPVEGLLFDVGIVEVVDEPVFVGGRGIAGARSDGFALAGFLRDAVAVGQIPGILGGGRVFRMPDHAAALEDQGLQAFFRELLGGPAAAHARCPRRSHQTNSFPCFTSVPRSEHGDQFGAALWTTCAFYWFRSTRPA